MEVAIHRRRSDRSGRAKLYSPGHPTARRADRQQFWLGIYLDLSAVDAALDVGVSWPVGVRWFREAGGMPPSQLRQSTPPFPKPRIVHPWPDSALTSEPEIGAQCSSPACWDLYGGRLESYGRRDVLTVTFGSANMPRIVYRWARAAVLVERPQQYRERQQSRIAHRHHVERLW